MRLTGKLSALVAVLAMCSGCQHSPSPVAAAAGEEALESQPRSPPSAAEIQARQEYVSCLTWAAHYADTAAATLDGLALVVAPLCYPQFSRYEAASMAALTGQRRRVFASGADRLQVEMAANAVRQERAEAALATNR